MRQGAGKAEAISAEVKEMTTRSRTLDPQASSLEQPRRASVPHDVSRRPDLGLDAGEPVVELQARVVGPGRRERAYLDRQEQLERALEAEGQRALERERELEMARLLERGAGRRLDKVEGDLDLERAQQKRLLLAMGAMQQELQGLRAQVSRLSAPEPAARKSIFARFFAR
jgi:hypothetical protein